jgi:demethylmenaquinone methyltransferase/2-methoxy-6-polyprenyl-1,4-benzoquinol methylase
MTQGSGAGSGTDVELDALLEEQLSYYRARADEYDDWFLRRNSYDRGAERNRLWVDQVEQLRAVLDAELRALPENARLLELACGTGLWTERLAAHSRASGPAVGVDAVDAAPEVLRLNRDRLRQAGLEDRVAFETVDLFDWRPARRYPFVFFGFWLSHVPEERWDAFWQLIDACLDDGGRFLFFDNLRTRNHPFSDQKGERARRTLEDGRQFDIVKVFHEPPELERRLRSMGMGASVGSTPDFFLYGTGERRRERGERRRERSERRRETGERA